MTSHSGRATAPDLSTPAVIPHPGGIVRETWLVMQLHYDLSRARKSPPRGVKSIG